MRKYFTRRCAKMVARAITKILAKAGVRVFAGVAVGVLLLGCGGAKNAAYVQDSSDYTSFGIDYHDIDRVIEGNIRSLLDSAYVRSLQGRKLLMIADITNETDEDIDVELIARKLARAMRKSGKFTLTNAIAGSGAKADKTINDSRKLTKDPRFNQYTTQEQGGLEAPELSLSGKIVQRAKRLGEVTRLDYMFLLTLSDLKSGKVLWDHEEIISKVTNANIASAKQHQSVDRELLILREQCRNEKVEACRMLVERDDIEWLKSACERGVGYACYGAGKYYEKNKNAKEQMLWNKKGCDIDNLYSCNNLGISYCEAKNYTQAFKIYTKACEGGEMHACRNLGYLYHKGLGVKQNGAKALDLYIKACEGREGSGCADAGAMYFGEAGIDKDMVKSRSYFHKGCNLNDSLSCNMLGVLYSRGEGGEQDNARALDLYEKTCVLDGSGCFSAGLLYEREQQYGEAKKLYERGCVLDGKACFGLAMLYFHGKGARQDYDQAKELYGKACDLGDQKGCEGYKILRDAGY